MQYHINSVSCFKNLFLSQEQCGATVVGIVEVYEFRTSFVGCQLMKKVCTDTFIKNYSL